MAWIKRNLFFVIGAVVALALIGFAGFHNFSGWKHNAEAHEELNKAYAELNRLNNQPVHPGLGKVDNIKLAREQQEVSRIDTDSPSSMRTAGGKTFTCATVSGSIPTLRPA